MKKYENVSYNEKNISENTMDIYVPKKNEFPVFIYFHGGGLEEGGKERERFYEALANKGVAIVTADYRMYPNAVFPDYLEDAAEVVAWVYKNIENYGKETGIFVGGSSAGGYMSQMLCFDKKYLAKHGIDSDSVSGYIHDAGQPTTHFNILRERGICTKRIVVDEAAPLYHIDENRDFAPMQIIVSDNDMKNRLEQTHLLVSTLKHFGYDENKLDFRVMRDSRHCSYVNKQNENGEFVFAEMVYEFISKHS